MATVIVGLVSDAHQARGLIRALDDAGFSGEDIDMSSALLPELAQRGIPDEDARVYAEGVRRGGTLVTARVEDAKAPEAQSILNRQSSVDLNSRAQVYQSAGWSKFDPKAPVYTADQVAKERELYR